MFCFMKLVYCFYLWHDWLTELCGWMLLHVVEFRSQFSTGNCSQLFTCTVYYNRQNYCLHPSLLCFGSQLLSKQKHISQISLELEKSNLKKSIHSYIKQTTFKFFITGRFQFYFWCDKRIICEMYRTRSWKALVRSFGLQLTIRSASSHKMNRNVSLACVKHWRKSHHLLGQIISALLLLKELISMVLWRFYGKP